MHPNPSPSNKQQSCIHCGECARVCPVALNPEALFFALVGDEWETAHRHGLEACSECNHCVEACPSHIPLVDWFRWGKAELRERARADGARSRFLARNARLAREREARAAQRREHPTRAAPPTQTISRAEVLAAIARGRIKRVRSSLIAAPSDDLMTEPTPKP